MYPVETEVPQNLGEKVLRSVLGRRPEDVSDEELIAACWLAGVEAKILTKLE